MARHVTPRLRVCITRVIDRDTPEITMCDHLVRFFVPAAELHAQTDLHSWCLSGAVQTTAAFSSPGQGWSTCSCKAPRICALHICSHWGQEPHLFASPVRKLKTRSMPTVWSFGHPTWNWIQHRRRSPVRCISFHTAVASRGGCPGFGLLRLSKFLNVRPLR